MPITFITGIDTDVGKTYSTALFARFLLKKGKKVITQKIAQTGCEKISEDIEFHRKVMGIEMNEDDRNGLTCPYIFKYPASPHLSAKLENQEINPDKITQATKTLTGKYQHLVIEGVGGVYVPLNSNVTLIDYLEKQNYPLIVVTSSKLGSINHTLLTLEALKNRKLNVIGLIYNRFADENSAIANDSINVFKKFMIKFGFNPAVVEIPAFEEDKIPDIDFSVFL